MKVYCHDWIGEDKNFYKSIKKYPFKITSTLFIEKENFGRDLLFLELEKKERNEKDPKFYVYVFDDDKVISEFLYNMGVKDKYKIKGGPIEEIVGKEVIGFTKIKGGASNIEGFVRCLGIKNKAEECKN